MAIGFGSETLSGGGGAVLVRVQADNPAAIKHDGSTVVFLRQCHRDRGSARGERALGTQKLEPKYREILRIDAGTWVLGGNQYKIAMLR